MALLEMVLDPTRAISFQSVRLVSKCSFYYHQRFEDLDFPAICRHGGKVFT
jgi:hypothetical protein